MKLTGKTYVAEGQKYTGQLVTIMGEDPLFGGTRYLVKAECGDVWSVDTELLRGRIQSDEATKQEGGERWST